MPLAQENIQQLLSDTLPNLSCFEKFDYAEYLKNQSRLTLSFTDSSHGKDILEFFKSGRKQKADPQGFVKPRSMSDLFKLASDGQVAIAKDADHKIQALCVAYPFDTVIDDAKTPVTEIGTVLSCVKGRGLSELTISAIAQKVHSAGIENHHIVAKVAANNAVANAFFKDKLGWSLERDPAIIGAYYTSEMGKSALHTDHSELKNWYRFDSVALTKAKLALDNAQWNEGNNMDLQFDL